MRGRRGMVFRDFTRLLGAAPGRGLNTVLDFLRIFLRFIAFEVKLYRATSRSIFYEKVKKNESYYFINLLILKL